MLNAAAPIQFCPYFLLKFLDKVGLKYYIYFHIYMSKNKARVISFGKMLNLFDIYKKFLYNISRNKYKEILL